MNMTLSLALGALISAVSAAVVLPAGAPLSTRPGTVAVPSNQGEKLYQNKGCYQCHGLNGQGAIGVGPTLHPGRLDREGFISYVRAPGGEMPPYSHALLPDAELDAILSWLAGLPATPKASNIALLARFGTPSIPKSGERPAAATKLLLADRYPTRVKTETATSSNSARLATGATVYAQNCAACHGDKRQGGIGPDLLNIGTRRSAAQIAAVIKIPPAGMPKLYPTPVNDGELAAIVAYLQGGAPSPATRTR